MQLAPLFFLFLLYAPVAELVDALDLGSSFSRSAGSSPVRRTTHLTILLDFVLVRFRPHGGTESFCGLARGSAPTLGLVRSNYGFGSS